MTGSILFADDQIHNLVIDQTSNSVSSQSNENKLLLKLQESCIVLGVNTLSDAKKSLTELGAFNVLILDWDFNQPTISHAEKQRRIEAIADGGDEDTDDYVALDPTTLQFIENNPIYSFLFIYSSQADQIRSQYERQLQAKFPERFIIRDKKYLENTDDESKAILGEIEKWKTQNEARSIPVFWSHSINSAVQRIFCDLIEADDKWLSEFYKTAKKDGVLPEIEVIRLFQTILTEQLVNDENLQKKITSAVGTLSNDETNSEQYAKLVTMMFFTSCPQTESYMTGDIFQDSKDSELYHIILTPECDVRSVTENLDKARWEVLSFRKKAFTKNNFGRKLDVKFSDMYDVAREKGHEIPSKVQEAMSTKGKEILHKANLELHMLGFTQTNPRFHTIPCYQFDSGVYSGIIQIDFKDSLNLIPGSELKREKRAYRLNAPFIQELRQRFFAYKGRVGVPGYSEELRKWLLEKNK